MKCYVANISLVHSCIDVANLQLTTTTKNSVTGERPTPQIRRVLTGQTQIVDWCIWTVLLESVFEQVQKVIILRLCNLEGRAELPLQHPSLRQAAGNTTTGPAHVIMTPDRLQHLEYLTRRDFA